MNETLRIVQKQKQEYKNILKDVDKKISGLENYRDEIMGKYSRIIEIEGELLDELKGD